VERRQQAADAKVKPAADADPVLERRKSAARSGDGINADHRAVAARPYNQ